MKKVFWGILLAMANIGGLLAMGLMLGGLGWSVWLNAAAQLSVALGYLILMLGAQDLPGGNFDWAAKFSKVLCAYTAAVVVLNLLNIMPGGIVSTVLAWASSLGSFLTMYFCVLGVADLERGGRCYLWADKLRVSFTAWVVLGLVSSFVPVAAAAEFIAYIVMLVFFLKAARAYKGGGGWRVY